MNSPCTILEADVLALLQPEADTVRFYPLMLKEPACRLVDGCMQTLCRDYGYWIA